MNNAGRARIRSGPQTGYHDGSNDRFYPFPAIGEVNVQFLGEGIGIALLEGRDDAFMFGDGAGPAFGSFMPDKADALDPRLQQAMDFGEGGIVGQRHKDVNNARVSLRRSGFCAKDGNNRCTQPNYSFHWSPNAGRWSPSYCIEPSNSFIQLLPFSTSRGRVPSGGPTIPSFSIKSIKCAARP